MKKYLFFADIFILCFIAVNAQNTAMQRAGSLGKGLNATNWLSHIHNPNGFSYQEYTEQDFAQIAQLGFDHIRLPVGLHYWTSHTSPYQTDTLILQYVDTALIWARKYHLKIILDYHNFIESLWQDSLVKHTDRLCAIWKTMAQRYATQNHDSVFYELYNEPGEVDKASWTYAAKRMIDTIRQYDPDRTIIVWLHQSDPVNPASFNDTNLIYTFHYYFPPEFTHQGSTWQSGGVRHTINIPFPYNPASMPPIDPGDIGTVHEAEYYAYPQTGRTDSVLHLLNQAGIFAQSYHVPLYCGEYGATVYAPVDSRIFWTDLVSKKLDSMNISRAHWGWRTGFFRLFNCAHCADMDSIYTDSAGYSILCALQVDSCNTTGLNKQTPAYRNLLHIFPNPAHANLNIEISAGQQADYLWLINAMGIPILQLSALPTETIHIDLSAYPVGIYFIKIKYKEQILQKAFLKL